jgi:hypothetical protein
VLNNNATDPTAKPIIVETYIEYVI